MLADDHALIREGLKSMINAQSDMTVVGEADNGRAAWLKVQELRPDLVVTDVSMPELGGAQLAELVRKDCTHVKVLALTIHEDQGYVRQLLKAGADGYILKRATPQDLIRAIRIVAGGGTYIDPAVATDNVPTHHAPTHAQESGNTALSEREAEVLRLIALGYSNKEIADQLHLSVKTIETYKVRLMEKLDLSSRSEIVRYAMRQGWLREA